MRALLVLSLLAGCRAPAAFVATPPVVTITSAQPSALSLTDTATIAWTSDTAGTYVVAVGDATIARGDVAAGAAQHTAVAGSALVPGTNVVTVLVVPSLRRAGKATTELTLGDSVTSAGAGSSSGTSGGSSSGASSGSSSGTGSSSGGTVLSLYAGVLGGVGSADDTGDAARFGDLSDLAMDGAGNVYTADTINNLIRQVTPAGVTTTAAGVPFQGSCTSYTAKPAIQAQFYSPSSLAYAAGVLYIGDGQCGSSAHGYIHALTLATSLVTTLPRTGANVGIPQALASDGTALYAVDANNLFEVDVGTGAATALLTGFGASTVTTSTPVSCGTATLPALSALAYDGATQTLYTTTDDGKQIYALATPAGTCMVSLFATGQSGLGHIAVDHADGVLFAARYSHYKVAAFTLATGAADASKSLGVDNQQDMTNGTAGSANFSQPLSVAFAGGLLYVGDEGASLIRRIDFVGDTSTALAGAPHSGPDLGNDDVPDPGPPLVTVPLTQARFKLATDLAAAPDGTLYVCDDASNAVKSLNSAGANRLTTKRLPCSTLTIASDGSIFTGGGETGYDDGENAVYHYVSGTVTSIPPDNLNGGGTADAGYNEGAAATAKFYTIAGIALDSDGSVIVADSTNNLIRRVTFASGGSTSWMQGTVASDVAKQTFDIGDGGSAGFADAPAGYNGVSPAPGTAQQAAFRHPSGLALSGTTLLIADTDNDCIRRMQTDTGVVSTFAGFCGHAGALDGQLGVARFNGPLRLRFDSAGTLYIGEVGNPVVRRIANALTAAAPLVETIYGHLDKEFGVKLGAVPGRLNGVFGLASTANGLFILSEGAVLQVH